MARAPCWIDPGLSQDGLMSAAAPACHACSAPAAQCPRCVCKLIGSRRIALRHAHDERAASLTAMQTLLDQERPVRALRADTAERDERTRVLRVEVERVRAEVASGRKRVARARELLATRRAQLERAKPTLSAARLAGAPPSSSGRSGGPQAQPPAALLEACRNLAALRRRLIRKLLRTYRVALLAPGASAADAADSAGSLGDLAAEGARGGRDAPLGELGAPRWSLLGLPVPPLTAGALEQALDPSQAATALGYLGHALQLAASYACVRLPFEVAFCGSRSRIAFSAHPIAALARGAARRAAVGAAGSCGAPSSAGPAGAGAGAEDGGGSGSSACGAPGVRACGRLPARSWPLYRQAAAGGCGGSDGSALLGLSLLGAAGAGWSAANSSAAAASGASAEEARAQLARAIAMLVANAHFLAVRCGLGAGGARAGGRPHAPAGSAAAEGEQAGGGARLARAIGAFDTLSTLVELSSASTLGWELRSLRGLRADGAEGPDGSGADELLEHAWGAALVSSVLHDGRGAGEGGWADGGAGALGAASRAQQRGAHGPHSGCEDSAVGWDLIERPRIPTPAQHEEILQWTRAMITDTVVMADVPARPVSRTGAA